MEGPKQAPGSLRALALMTFSTLGVIYSDIGTSPIYVLNGIFPASGETAPATEDVVGALSAIIWALTIVPLVKYCLIALRFGTGDGEGGPFALFSSLYPARDDDGDEIAAITTQTRAPSDVSSLTHAAPHRPPLHDGAVTRIVHRPLVHACLLVVAVFAVALTLSDGALTPAVSVVTAVAGIRVVAPGLDDAGLVGVSAAILVVLYSVQPFGTHKISRAFSPCVSVWLLLLAGGGIANITHYPAIWRAVNPLEFGRWFARTEDWTVLNGVLLCVTGSEAFFACLGQFSAPSIQLGFALFVYPAVSLAYLGQGARLVVDGLDVLPNVFYLTIPGGTGGALYYITLLSAILAAVIASQAMITASFSLLVQLVGYHAFPALRIVHTSDRHRGQVYLPAANVVLLAGSLGLVAGFGTEAGLTNAYGFAVAGVFLCTTLMLALSMPVRRGWPVAVALAFAGVYALVDGALLAAAATKVPHGAAVPLGVALAVLAFCLFWRWAKGLEHAYAYAHRVRLPALLAPAHDGELVDDDVNTPEDKMTRIESSTSAAGEKPAVEAKDDVSPAYADQAGNHLALRLVDRAEPLVRVPMVALFHKISPGSAAPASFEAMLRALPGLPTIVVFLTVKTVDAPYLAAEERLEVHKIRTAAGFYRATARFGYRDEVDLRGIKAPLVDRLIAAERRAASESDGSTTEMVGAIRAAAGSAVTHVLPSYEPVCAPSQIRWRPLHWARAFAIEGLYARLQVLVPDDGGYRFEQATLRVRVAAAL